MKVREISFREWIICKVRTVQSGVVASAVYIQSIGEKMFRERTGRDRRAEETDAVFSGREWRRLPERRLPEVKGSSLDEFERWKK